jgi:hypothetical protein
VDVTEVASPVILGHRRRERNVESEVVVRLGQTLEVVSVKYLLLERASYQKLTLRAASSVSRRCERRSLLLEPEVGARKRSS